MYRITKSLCTDCGTCIDYCMEGAISVRSGVYSIDQSCCTGCGSCREMCANEAIHLVMQEEQQDGMDHTSLDQNGMEVTSRWLEPDINEPVTRQTTFRI